jgi:hypothetical protein
MHAEPTSGSAVGQPWTSGGDESPEPASDGALSDVLLSELPESLAPPSPCASLNVVPPHAALETATATPSQRMPIRRIKELIVILRDPP